MQGSLFVERPRFLELFLRDFVVTLHARKFVELFSIHWLKVILMLLENTVDGNEKKKCSDF